MVHCKSLAASSEPWTMDGLEKFLEVSNSNFKALRVTLPRIVYFLKFDLYDDLIDVPIMHQIIERFTLSNIKIV